MKYLKLLGLAAMAALTLTALPAGAEANETVFCTVQESPCPEANRWATGTKLDFSLKSGASAKLEDTSGNSLDTCTGSTAKGSLEKAEGVTGPIESLTWSGCTFTTTTLKAGKLEVEHIAGTHNGMVKADGAIEVTIDITIFSSSCVYGVEAGTSLGQLEEGKPATFISNAVIKKFSGSVVCPSTAKWTGSYTLTEPAGKTLSVEAGTTGSVFCTTQESPCPEGNRWEVGTELDFSIPKESSVKLVDTSGNTLDTCTGSTAKGKLEKPESVTGSIESLTWSGCTFTTTTLKAGKLEVEHIAGTHNGTVKADGTTEVTINTALFGSCVYGVEAGTDLGVLKEGKPATFVANAVVKLFSGKLCPQTAKWTAEYTLTAPIEKTLSVEYGTARSVFCATQESPCPEANRWAAGTELDFSLKSGTSALLASTGGEELDTCSGSTAKWKLEALEPVKGPWEALTWSGCSFETTTPLLGKTMVKSIGAHNGTVTAESESRITINGKFFGSCLYGAEPGTDLGELKEGKPATFGVNAVVKKQTGSAGSCPETAKWTAEYTLTEPKEKTLSVEVG